MPKKPSVSKMSAKTRAIREQRLVVDELVAQLTLSQPEMVASYRTRLEAEQMKLNALEKVQMGGRQAATKAKPKAKKKAC
jgi:hypothetical protein